MVLVAVKWKLEKSDLKQKGIKNSAQKSELLTGTGCEHEYPQISHKPWNMDDKACSKNYGILDAMTYIAYAKGHRTWNISRLTRVLV